MLRFSHCWQLVLGVFVLPLSTTLWGQVSVPAKQASTPTSSIPPVAMGQQHLQLMQLLEQIPPYRPTKSIKGKADLSGSTTMYDLGHQWAMNFKQFHPEVEFAGTAEGSEAAIKMLANDPTIIAGVSRQVDLEDQKLLQAGRCKDPMAIVVATDALVLYVHKDNPIATTGISPEQLQKLFGADASGVALVKNWGGLGVTGGLANQPIQVYDRESGSASHNFISKTLLAGGKQVKAKASVKSNAEVCKAISTDIAGAGLGEMASHQANVKKVPLLVQGQLVQADESSVLAGRYPLMRPLMLVVDKQQLKSDGGLREAVLQYVLSKDGQTEVMKAGFFPLNPGFIRQQLDAISGQQLR